MNEREQQPSEIAERIEGTHADIVLSLPVELWKYLDKEPQDLTLYESKNADFDYPLKSMRLDYFRESDDDINFNLDVAFDADAIAHGPTAITWQTRLAIELKALAREQLNMPVHCLSHQARDFYIELDSQYAVHVQFSSDVSDCHISAYFQSLPELYEALDMEYQTSGPGDTSIDLLTKMSRVWSLIIDTVPDTFGGNHGEQDEKPQITIAAPIIQTHPYSVESTIPEIERTTSQDDAFALIGGLTYAKAQLEDIAATFNDTEGAAMYGISERHFLLYGPPGTGKTSLIRAFTSSIGAKLFDFNSTDIIDKYVGQSGKNFKQVLAGVIDHNGPAVAFFDEFDAIGGKPNGSTNERVDVKRLFNQAIEEITSEYPHVVIACATNADLDDLEPSLIRSGRLTTIGAPAPNAAERVEVWAAVLARSFQNFMPRELAFDEDGEEVTPTFLPYDDDIDPPALAHMTDGMTGADFSAILESARRKCYRHYRRTGEHKRVTQTDLVREITRFGQ